MLQMFRIYVNWGYEPTDFSLLGNLLQVCKDVLNLLFLSEMTDGIQTCYTLHNIEKCNKSVHYLLSTDKMGIYNQMSARTRLVSGTAYVVLT